MVSCNCAETHELQCVSTLYVGCGMSCVTFLKVDWFGEDVVLMSGTPSVACIHCFVVLRFCVLLRYL